ncbi:helix-turn-helix domain-containing protein [Photobacterium damselae subsp. damselae]|uniref:helix-turn-helix domain-containing protein n=1 Tax=Photobacterium damselae TaxID=38293 RepID=UPI001F233EC9|nr:helix-turn-helix transcriptional regulator [Photobacterium damselae]UJZ95015.1 helix-turn-helix domain-containing protein [Photobacterium damselae subsp. damselae]UJZ98996.1 helix-turn-helix domain-containing protein [Photobacterium damselae subsp. damselae]
MQIEEQKLDKSSVKAALERLGVSMADLARENNISPSTLRNVWRIPYLKGEKIIANAIDVPPEDIWPERYLKRTKKKAL